MDIVEINWDNILLLFGRITLAIMIAPVIVAIFYKKYWNRALLAAFGYFLTTFLLNLLEQFIIWSSKEYRDIVMPFFDYWGIDNTFFTLIFFYVKDYIFLGWFFSLIFPQKNVRNLIKWVSVIIALASIINYLFIEGYKVFGVFNPAVNMIYIVGLPLIYLWYSQRESLRIPLQKNPYFWISMGLLIPNLLALFFYFTGDYLFESDFKLYVILNSIRNGFEVIGLVLVCIGFSKARYVRFITTEDTSEAEEHDAPSVSQ